MNGQAHENKVQEGQDFLQELQEQYGFKITPCEGNAEVANKKGVHILNLTPEQKGQVSELLQHIPAVTAAGTMAEAYRVSFPIGLPHTLMGLKRGGFSSQIVAEGKGILGTASLYPMAAQAAVLGVFTVMSIATGQFFLMQINKELRMINKKLDEILKFLYEEKKAELLSEVIFVKYACDNYDSIMVDEAQRTATIGNIQQAKKIAMKDIEFYQKYLDGKIESGAKKKFGELVTLMDDEIALNIDSLDMALQLYLISSLMEVYYARNYQKKYIDYVEDAIKSYVESCSRMEHLVVDKMDAYFSSCKTYQSDKINLQNHKNQLIEWKKSIDARNGDMEKLYAILHTANESAEYYITADGNNCNIYYKVS